MHDTPERLVWMAGFVAAAAAACRAGGILRPVCYAGLAVFCFKQAA